MVASLPKPDFADGHADPSKLKPDTRLVVGGRDPSAHHGFVNPPVYHASTVLYGSAEDLIAHGTRAAERALDSIQEAIHVLAPVPEGTAPKASE